MKKKAKTPVKYEIKIDWSEEDKVYVVTVPELPGCMTHGDTPEEAAKMAGEAIEGHIEAMRKIGKDVPPPLAEEKFSGNLHIRVEPSTHRDLAIKARMSGRSLNSFLKAKLSEVTV